MQLSLTQCPDLSSNSTITIDQLSEDNAEQLVPANKMLNVLIAIVFVNHAVKNSLGQKL
jgi:hypothetical protein